MTTLRFIRLFFCLAAGLAAQTQAGPRKQAPQARDIFKFGQPACDGQVMDKDYFILCYNEDLKIPLWVGERLTKSDVTCEKPLERGSWFKPDPELPKGKRAELSDYKNNGKDYDRGHMANFKNHACDGGGRITFLLSNMIPQKAGFNRGHWRELEVAVRKLAEDHGEVWIFTGPFDWTEGTASQYASTGGPGKWRHGALIIGSNKVHVPDAFFKVILCVHPDRKHVIAADAANDNSAQIQFTTLQVVEVETGLKFFGRATQAEHDLLNTAEELELVPDAISTQAVRKFRGRK
jgi:endonuclease G, mitochondrial